jgi:hypothetical protein
MTPGEKLVQQHAQHVEVGGRMGLHAGALLMGFFHEERHDLGGLTVERAGRHPIRQGARERQVHRAEIDEEGFVVPLPDQEVVGLEVAVTQAALVHELQTNGRRSP